MRVAMALLLLLLVEAVVGANVTQSRTYFSEVFRMRDGTKATFEVFVSSRASGQPEAMGVTFPDPDLMDLASAGAWALTDFFSTNVSSPEQAALFARVLGVQYLPRGTAGGGSRDAVNSALIANKTAYAAAAASSPWAVEQFGFLFSLLSFEQLQRIVCEDYPPCAGDVTPFVLLPPPVFLPSSFYANYLTLAPRQGIAWSANQLESQSTFAQQPALTFDSYNGQVTAWQPRLALPLLRALRDGPPQACAAFEVSWPQPREYAVAGWYPNSLRVSYDRATARFSVTMGQLQYRVDYASKLAAISKLQSDVDNLKSLLEQLLAKPPADQIIINNEFQGMLTKAI